MLSGTSWFEPTSFPCTGHLNRPDLLSATVFTSLYACRLATTHTVRLLLPSCQHASTNGHYSDALLVQAQTFFAASPSGPICRQHLQLPKTGQTHELWCPLQDKACSE
jgi:hypothetical protein